MNRNTLILILCTTFSLATLQAGPAETYLAARSTEAQERADKLADAIAAVLVNSLRAAPVTREQAKLGKDLAGIAKSAIAIERQGNQKLKLAGLNIKGYLIYQKLLGMLQLRAELTKALLNELQKPGLIENIVNQAHELARYALDGVAASDNLQALCDLVTPEKVKSVCVMALSHAYERSVRPPSGKNTLVSPALALKLKQLSGQVAAAAMKCCDAVSGPKKKELITALLALLFRMEERIYNAVEQALNSKL